MPSSTQKASSTNGLFVKLLPSLTVNTLFVLQAIVFHWRIGTLVWIYWVQGFLLVLIGIRSNRKSIGWTLLLLIMTIYGMFLLFMTFPSSTIDYTVNGARVAPQKFTVLSNVQWLMVLLNAGLLLGGYLAAAFLKKDLTAYSGIHVIKRIFPLHLTILLAVFISWPVILFAILRSLFDVLAEYAVARLQTK